MSGAGQTQVATRPGSMIVTNFGSPPGMPTLLAQGALNAQLGALEGRRAPQGGSGGGGSGRNADQAAQSSGLSGVNSGQSVRIIAPGVQDNFGSGPGPRNRNPNDTVLTALSNANQAVQTTTAVQEVSQQLQQQAAAAAAAGANADAAIAATADAGADRRPGTLSRQAPKTVSRPSTCRRQQLRPM